MGLQRQQAPASNGRSRPVPVRHQRIRLHSRQPQRSDAHQGRHGHLQASADQGGSGQRPQGGLHPLAQDISAGQQGERHKVRHRGCEVRGSDSRFHHPRNPCKQGIHRQARAVHARPAQQLRMGQAHQSSQLRRRPQDGNQGLSGIPGLLVQVRAHQEQAYFSRTRFRGNRRAVPPHDRNLQVGRHHEGRLLRRLPELLHLHGCDVPQGHVRHVGPRLHEGRGERPRRRDAGQVPGGHPPLPAQRHSAGLPGE